MSNDGTIRETQGGERCVDGERTKVREVSGHGSKGENGKELDTFIQVFVNGYKILTVEKRLRLARVLPRTTKQAVGLVKVLIVNLMAIQSSLDATDCGSIDDLTA
jgi:hypothetical protein